MSLRAFHLLFIALSAALALFMSAWATGQYRMGAGPGYAAVALASLLGAGALTVYGSAFRRKTQNL
jgi:hypothetical protein